MKEMFLLNICATYNGRVQTNKAASLFAGLLNMIGSYL